ncbi:MAG: site-2 protease family protein [Rhodoglobus sp.]
MTTSGMGRGNDRARYGENVPRDPGSARRATSRRPSPIFLGLVAGAALSGWALWSGIGPAAVMAFLFVLFFWVISLSLHEFAHALVAYRNGDESVVYRGYLTLDPLRYTHVMFSLVLPLVFLIAGGIGLPGGAVFINRSAIRTRLANSAVSAAGPLTNLAIALVLAAVLTLREGSSPFWVTMAFLLFLQVTAAVLNLLPVPGLDGFGIIQPYLPDRVLRAVAPIAPFAMLGLFALLWIPALNTAFFSVILGIIDLLGVPPLFVWSGLDLFRFWS